MLIVNILIFLLVLSILVAVHEFGHFIVAKACNIYVDRFSIGMPPRVAGFKWGETDYCIGALPIGGYVKMAGQEDAPLDDETREREYGHVPPDRWFNKKPVYQRILVLLGGPVANILLAVALYTGIVAFGTEVPESQVSSRIGVIEKNSPAESAPLYREVPGQAFEAYTGAPETTGWQTGDVVVAIDGKPVSNMQDLIVSAVLGGDSATHHAVIERTALDGTTVRYVSPIVPKLISEEDANPRYGVGAFMTPLIGEVLPDTPAAAAGLQKGDIILAANDKIVDWISFQKLIENAPSGETVRLLIKRGAEKLTLEMTPMTMGRLRDVTLGTRDTESEDVVGPVEVFGIGKEAAEKTGLQRRDIVTQINGEAVSPKAFNDIVEDSAGQEVRLKVERPAILFGLLQSAETLELTVPVDRVSAIGIMAEITMVPYDLPASRVLPEALAQSWRALDHTFGTLVALLTGTVSAKELGGPLMIAQLTSRASENGIGYLVYIMAFISINLAVFNLLPLPVLDGGQIVVNAIEGIRRKPLPQKFIERFQMAGLALIIFLMLFVTWNDVGRWIDGLRP